MPQSLFSTNPGATLLLRWSLRWSPRTYLPSQVDESMWHLGLWENEVSMFTEETKKDFWTEIPVLNCQWLGQWFRGHLWPVSLSPGLLLSLICPSHTLLSVSPSSPLISVSLLPLGAEYAPRESLARTELFLYLTWLVQHFSPTSPLPPVALDLQIQDSFPAHPTTRTASAGPSPLLTQNTCPMAGTLCLPFIVWPQFPYMHNINVHK